PTPNAVLSLRNVSGMPVVQRGNRNDTLFTMLGREAHHLDDLETLLDVGRTRNSEFAEPLDDREVESRALRKLLREAPTSPYVFISERRVSAWLPGQAWLRNPCAFYRAGLHRSRMAQRNRQRRAMASGADPDVPLARIPNRDQRDVVAR